MSFLRKEDKTSLSTPIPADTNPEAVVRILHDHEFIIKLGSAVESFKLTNGSKGSQASYAVVDKKPIGRVTFELDIANASDGSTQEVTGHPPVGVLKIYTKYTVVQKGQGGQWFLDEDVRIEAMRAMVGTVKSNIDKTHPENHQKILAAARASSG